MATAKERREQDDRAAGKARAAAFGRAAARALGRGMTRRRVAQRKAEAKR